MQQLPDLHGYPVFVQALLAVVIVVWALSNSWASILAAVRAHTAARQTKHNHECMEARLNDVGRQLHRLELHVQELQDGLGLKRPRPGDYPANGQQH